MKRIASRFAQIETAMTAARLGHLLGTALRVVRGSAFSAVVFLSLFAGAARADIKTLHDTGKVTWGTSNNPQVIYLLDGEACGESDPYDEIVLKFTDTTNPGTLNIATGTKVSARALVVGGGGAGGTSTNTTVGAGGGGGAGGFIDQTQTLEAGTYTITVGAGGLAATTLDTASGNDGNDSSFVGGTVSLTAKGGGGGGAKSVGNPGGSGGGGSRASATCNGGDGETDQGFSGGKGATAKFGGGGGGAGAAGKNTATTTGPGAGGAGLPSDIILDDNGEAIYYAGGGGGGSMTSKQTAKSNGGGGAGAKGGDSEAGAGDDGFGGGGGGGGNACAGGKGGDGVVILRIRDMIITPPEDIELEWNGENQIGYEPKNYYEIVEFSGDVTNATNAGTYRYHVKPAGDFEWATWEVSNKETKTVEWKIAPMSVDIPTSVAVTYDGDSHEVASSDEIYEIVDGTAVATNAGEYSFTLRLLDTANTAWSDGTTTDKTTTWSIVAKAVLKPAPVDALIYSGTNSVAFTEYDGVKYVSGVTNSVNAGSFDYTVRLDNPVGYTNYVWFGESGDASVADATVSWGVAPKTVVVPTAKTDLVYNGEAKNAFESLDWSLYELVAGTTTNETAGGTYEATFHLTGNDATKTNYVWDTTPATFADKAVAWTIAAAANEITSLEMTGWRIGVGTPTEPTIEAKFGKDTATYEYGFGSNVVEVTEWITDKNAITNAGTWIVKATIAETSSWTAAEKTKTFGMWSDPRKAYRNHVDITINPGNTTTLTNFPALIKISESRILGFKYAEAGSTGNDISFMPVDATEDTDPLPCEVDTWNTSGESYIWVCVPEIPAGGTTITMYWYLGDGMAAPPVEPTTVWTNGYIGVWHMTEANGTVADATGHGLTGTPSQPTTMIATAGKVGNARINATKVANGTTCPALQIPNYNAYLSNVSRFAVGGWFFARDMTHYPRVFSRKTNYDNNTGWEMEFKENSKTEGTIRGSNATTVTFTTPNMLQAGWVHLLFVFNDAVGTAYTNGTQSASGAIAKVVTRNDGMTIGSDLDLTEWCWGGYYDECRLYDGVPSADWIKAEYATVADDSVLVYAPIVHDGIMDNWWVEEPTMDKTSWDVSETPGTINPGVLAAGTVSNIIYSVYDPTQTFESIADITEAGSYRVYFLPTEPERYVPIDYTIDFRIVKSKPYTKIGGTNGNSGRVLLMNRDTNAKLPTKERCPIDRQGYNDTSSAQSTFWQIFDTEESGLLFNLKPGANSILWTRNYGDKLWHLVNCRHGNTYPKDVESGNLDSNQAYLPFSSTSYSILQRTTLAKQNTVGQVVMRNVVGASVYSPCYTNGIGTIYFDAVNGWKGITENNNIVVEIATNTVEELPPTDANCMVLTTNVVAGVEVVDTNWYGKLDETCWHKWTMHPFVITNGTEFFETSSTKELSLQMDIGGRADSFYRVVVPVDYRDAVRFRIRRTSEYDHETQFTEDQGGLILLDNIIASPPAMGANLESPGFYDGDKTGKRQLGWELATNVPYPSVEDDELYGGAKATYYVNEGDGSTYNTNEFFHSAAMYYRWRYLGNATNSWREINLKTDDGFKAMSKFELPGFVCDVEYWYKYTLQAPFYRYVDYSGIGKTFNYTEERGTLTSAYSSSTPLLSGGTNWFFRVREGASQYERMLLTVDDRSSGTVRREIIDMDIVGSHQWRGFVPVTNKTERSLSFRIVGATLQDDGTTELDGSGENDAEFRASVEKIDISSAPYAGTMMKVGEEVGYVANIHYLTNVASYIEFQFNDETKAISISHADYQDFNEWFSSRCENDNALKFYSSAHETNSTTIATKRYPAEATNKVVSTFAETPRTATAWHETFQLTGAQTLAGYPMNVPFQSERTPKGWLADQGMWVAQKWGMTNSTDFALQMEGRGKGAVTFNLSPTPNGLDTIEFATRLAQFNEFKNVSFSWEQIMRRNYTIAAQACFDTDPQFRNFSGEASVSLFTGYVPSTGGYEYRITIYNIDEKWKTGKTEYQRACVRHAIYKWHVEGSKLVDELLVEVLDNEAAAGGWFWTSTNKSMAEMVKQLPLGLNGTQYSGMYMSFSNANNKVYITAGVSNDQADKDQCNVDFKYTSKNFQQIGCEDPSPVTTFGTYGVLIKNCPGRVLYPRIYEGKTVPIPGSGATDITGGKRWNGQVSLLTDTTGSSAERSKIGTYWAKEPGRVVELTGDPWGLVATNIAQQIGVYTMPVGSSDNWTCLTNISVNTFNSDAHRLELQSTKPSYVKFASSGEPDDIRTDIVIDNIMLTQWCGQSGSSTNASSSYGYADDFYYTGSWISNRVDSTKKTQRVALLAPRRAESTESPIGIRSPYINGLGAIIFDYCDAGAGAKLELQAWTGALSSLYSHLEDAADKAGWTTLTNWTFAAGESGTKSYYYGLRSPSNGVFRLVIPQSKVREAYAHPEYDPNWGAVTITDVYCYDEPPFDSHSWWGWNFLTTGWSDAKGNKFAAIDDSKEGAVGVLNNTLAVNTLETGNANDYNMNDPFIQSPTFNDRNVGEIAFRARAYESGSTSYITVWGAKRGDMQKGESWTAITNVPIDSVTYTRHVVKCADEQGFAAIRLGVANVPDIMAEYTMAPAAAAVLPANPVRVLVDEIVIRERVKPEVGFRLDFARPFRLGLSERTAVPNIASRDQQPLLNEQFGFQAEVEITGLSDEVDLDHTPEVRLSLYPKAEPWGYVNWKEAEGAVLDVVLEPAEGTNLVFRSMSTTPLSFAGPFEADPELGYGMVQYYLTVKYWDKGGDPHTTPITAQQWQMPSWYQGFDDPNEREGAKFSPFTVLDTVSPGRAWFNEVNFSDENGNNAKQFVEVCFPANYDMTGWRIYRYDVWGYQDLIASLGLTTGVPSTKAATGGDPNFAFLSLTSQGATAHPDADASWSSDAGACGGTDSYGFQLIRPSGIVEQQIVVQGKLGSGRYSNNKLGTNVVVQLEQLVGGTWEFVGADTNTAVKSSGVFQNAGSLPSDWNDVMDMTPGMINGDQTIPPDWFLPPSGTNVWLSLSTLGAYVWIVDGEDRVAAKTIVVPQGTTTNLVFETAPWYQLAALMRDVTNDVTSAAVRSAGTARTNVWTYAFQEDARNSATLVASAKPDEEMLARGGLDPNDPYTPAIMKWLLGGEANGEPFEGDEISTNCFFWGLSAGARPVPLPLKDRYWLDIDPTSDAWDLRGGMGEISNLSAPTPTVPVVAEVRRDRPMIWPERLTNRVVTVALMISNKVDNARSRAPNRLQGLGGEKSDVVGAKNWTSETFKVTMSLIKPEGAPGIDVSNTYWPMASFVFAADSFGAPDGPNPFSARIEVADPMTKASPAYTYGWWKYPGSTYGYKWDLSHGTYMRDPDVLTTTNTWDKTWEATSDW